VAEVFERVEERLVQTQASEGSVLVGKQLSELDLAAKMGVDIIAIHRDKEWMINPKETVQIKQGDVIVVRGTYSGIEDFIGLAEGKRRTLEEYGLSRRREKQFKEIVERLVELKDTSELMIDLAYSSVLLNSRELAEEVQRLEEYVDKLHTEVAQDSPLVNKTLREARIPDETGMWVLAIRRGDRCLRPRGEWKIQAGDVLIASGYAEGEEDLMKLASLSSVIPSDRSTSSNR
jgi:uncharacterized protein with PhoU and TrkA domain